MDKYVKTQALISLGESTHGSKEVFQMKRKVIKHLVEEHNFTVFAIEVNTVECALSNNYTQSGNGNLTQLLVQLGYWVWITQEVLDMVIWMKNYNSTHHNQIQFTGFDMHSFALKGINNLTTSNKLNDFILQSMKLREIGSMKRDDQFFKPSLIIEYDAIIHIKKTTVSNILY